MDTLATERLSLRPPTVDDAERFWPHVSNPELPYYMTWEAHRDLEETRGFLRYCEDARAQGTALTWAMFAEDGALVGLVGLHDITRTFRAWRKDVAELGYWTAPPAQGRGYVTEAARTVLELAFTSLGLHKVTVGHLAENVRSQRVIEKLGFRPVGVLRDHAFRHGRWWDQPLYELLEREWRALPPGRGR